MLRQARQCADLIAPGLRLRWAVLVPLILLSGLFEASGTAAIFALVRVVADPESIDSVPILAEVSHWLPQQDPQGLIGWFTLLVGLFYLAKNGIAALAEYTRARTTGLTTSILSVRLLRGYLNAPYSFHLRRNSASLIHNMSRAVSVDFGMTLAAFTQIIAEGLVLIGIVTVLLIVSPQVTLLAGGTLLLIAFGFVRLTRRMVLQLGRRSQILAAAVLQGQQQALGAIKEIKVLGRGGFFEAAYRRGEFELMRLRYLDVLFQTLPRILIETLFICGALVVIVSITLGGSPGSHTVSLLGLYAYAGFRIIPSTNRIVWQITALRHGRAAVDIVHSDFFSVYPLGWADEEPPAPSASLEFSALVRFEDVSFQYPETTRPAIDGINLEIRKGESVGIVGATGSGKSTLVDLLVGLLEPTSGRILIDVTELRGRERSWQSEIGYVPQAICLVDDTLRHNITLGIDPAEIDPVQLAVAIELAQIERLVESLPNGIDTLVGERGVRLSGGERQRIGIARALYHQPAVVVFDEATSALDNRTEADLVKAIDELRGTKTLVLIAHRLSSVRNCDRIVFLSDGCVAAMGTFDELLAKSAEFRAMAVVPEIEKKSA